MNIRFITASALAIACSASVAAPSNAQCVYTSSKPVAGGLSFNDLPVYEKPTSKSPMFVIKQGFALWAVEKRGQWLRVTGSADSAPFADGAVLGWVKQTDVDPQELRNCN